VSLQGETTAAGVPSLRKGWSIEALCLLRHPWRCPVRCIAFVSLYAPEAKSTLETQQLDSAAAI